MSLTNYWTEPYYTLDDFDTLFDEALARQDGQRGRSLSRRGSQRNINAPIRPRLDLHVDDKNNVITGIFELPGIKKEDINIEVSSGVLTVSGESKREEERKEGSYTLRERSFGRFSRSLSLPKGVKESDVKASYENGVLTVSFPKTSAEAAPKRIKVA